MENPERIRNLEHALALLFGQAIQLPSPALAKVDASLLKRAYYRRAQEFHPDKASLIGIDPEILSLRFQAISEAYQLALKEYAEGFFSYLAKVPFVNAQQIHAERPKPAERPVADPIVKPTVNPPPRKPPPSPEHRIIYHTAGIPERRLRFAQFLYYSGHIDWQTLINALSWQYRTRPKMGEIACNLGFMGQSDIIEIIRGREVNEFFGQSALRYGILEPHHVPILLGKQRLTGYPIGRYFLDQGIFTQAQIDRLLAEHRMHNYRY
jgi:hypothetical protein